MAEKARVPGMIVAAIGGAVLAYAVLRVAAPFAGVLAAAAIVAAVAHPLERRLRRRLPPAASSGLLAAGIGLALLLPLSLGAWYLARESVRAYPLVRRALDGLAAPQAQPPPWLPGPAQDYLRDFSLGNVLLENVQEIGAWSGRLARTTAANAALLAADVLIFFAGLFLFLRDGEAALEALSAALPLPPEARRKIERRARDMTIAVVEGVFAVALVQGALAMLGFALFGVRFPVLLGVLCMVFSPVPFIGPAVVWVPVAAAAALGGQAAKALLVAGWFVVVVGVADNLVRPLLIGKRARVPLALVVVGVLGGLKAFGVLGAFLGPVIVALAAATAEVLLEEAAR